MEKNTEKKTTSAKLNAFLEKNRKGLLVFFIIVIVGLVGFIAYEVFNSSITNKGLTAIDTISYELTNKAVGLDDAELTARKNSAMEKLNPYLSKGGITGVRANLLAAEIAFNSKNYDDAINYYNQVVSKGRKSYTAPIAYYNIGTCYEQKNDLNNAAENYKSAVEYKDFVLRTHAQFSYGRVLYTLGKFDEANTALQELVDENPDDSWAELAKTIIIQMKADGKIN
ncbi:MAG: tetratricopeptide repeat protein [Treponema sp.]|nr:tetratricopeptide repeat protein [Treponema sp.]